MLDLYGKNFRLHLGLRPNLVVSSVSGYRSVLASSVHISKGYDYQFLWPWLGQGLLTSGGDKWRTRRKLLTPAFHGNILRQFLDSMISHAEKLSSKLDSFEESSQECDLSQVFSHCSLDIICETVMGQDAGAQDDSSTPYVMAVVEITDIVFHRVMSPWLWPDFTFFLSPRGRRLRQCVHILHSFTQQVINQRLSPRQQPQLIESNNENKKKKLALLDLLIEAHLKDGKVSISDIIEEANTFMFEGHDTVSTNMTFCLHLLARHPDSQRKCQEELDDVFQHNERLNFSDLPKLKYLENCIKEALRLFPSIPTISRRLLGEEDLDVDGQKIPAGTNIILLNYHIQRDQAYFHDPHTFRPERFEVSPQNYSFVPFSAGPRNCIGQKFAMMEEKIILTTILRKFDVAATTNLDDIPLLAELVLRPQRELLVKFTRRKTRQK